MRTLITRTMMFLLFASLCAFMPASSAPAGDMAMPAEVEAEFKKEPPLGQADIDEYLKLVPEIMQADDDPQAMLQILGKSKLSPTRFSLVGLKLGLAIPVIEGAGEEVKQYIDSFPPSMRPTDAEVELVKKNMSRIKEVMEPEGDADAE